MTARTDPRIPVRMPSGFDRAAAEREDDGLLDRLRADEASRVLVLHADTAQVTGPSGVAPGSSTGDPRRCRTAHGGRSSAAPTTVRPC